MGEQSVVSGGMSGRRKLLLAGLLTLGVSMLVLAAVFDGDDYVSSLLLELGAAVVLVVPIVYVERLVADTRTELGALFEQSSNVADRYEWLRQSMRSGGERTRLMESLVRTARDDAKQLGFTRAQAAQLFHAGGPGQRVYALGLMQGNHDAIDDDVVREAIRDSESAFEQYHALYLARDAWSGLSRDRQIAVLDAISEREAAGDNRLGPGSDRAGLIAEIRAKDLV